MGMALCHASICGCFLPSGNEKYEKVLKEVIEKMEDSQREEAVVLGEAVATEPPPDPLDAVVRMAAAPFDTCHPPPVSFGPLQPTAGFLVPCWHLGPPCPTPP